MSDTYGDGMGLLLFNTDFFLKNQEECVQYVLKHLRAIRPDHALTILISPEKSEGCSAGIVTNSSSGATQIQLNFTAPQLT